MAAGDVHVGASSGMQLEAVPAVNADADLGMRNGDLEVRTYLMGQGCLLREENSGQLEEELLGRSARVAYLGLSNK